MVWKCVIIHKEVGDKMKLPNLMEAKKRTNEKVKTKTNEYIVTHELQHLGEGLFYYVKTYGCQMNEHDSENIKAILEDMGYKEANSMETADLVILNTCAIRDNAHNKVFGMIGRLKHSKETNPNLMIAVCGCMAQEEHVVEEIMKKYKAVDLVFGTHNIYHLPQLLQKALEKKGQEIEVYSMEGDVIENIPTKRDNPYKAWVNIQYGCDKFCTYCIVPYTRGKQRSREKEYIIDEVKQLVEDGYLEVTLLGQNVNAYGKDLYDDYTMANLLEDVSKTGIKRLRFVTSHPWDFTDDMIDVIAQYDNVMPFVHLPLQSGDSEILRRMGRRYTRESYLELFYKIKERIPNVAISTDIIVGFPDESDEQFENTISLVEECQFDNCYTFIFSARPGTPASKMEDPIDMDTKSKRLARLNKIWNQYALEKNKAYEGRIVTVLVDGFSKKDKHERKTPICTHRRRCQFVHRDILTTHRRRTITSCS